MNRHASRASRFAKKLIARDGGCRCAYCGKDLIVGSHDTSVQACVDHIVPLKRGGTDDLDNLTFACRVCNSRKGWRKTEAKDILKYGGWVRRFLEVI